MKKILILCIICLTTICITLPAQSPEYFMYKTEKTKKPFLSQGARVILTYAGSIMLNAAGDALYDKGITAGGNYKVFGKSLKVMSIGTLVGSFLWIDYDKSNWLTYFATYGFLRFSLFDPTYNLTRGLPITYIGTTSVWDKTIQKLKPPDGLMAARGVSLIMGISLPLNNLNPIKLRHNKTFDRDYLRY